MINAFGIVMLTFHGITPLTKAAGVIVMGTMPNALFTAQTTTTNKA